MARKGKKKKSKKERRYSLNITKFQKTFCRKCQVCYAGTKSSFCYNIIYKDCPRIFVHDIWPQLNKVFLWPEDTELSKLKFNEIFCNSAICQGKQHAGCGNLTMCFNAFVDQIEYLPSYNLGETIPSKVKRKKGKNKSNTVNKTPKPTFFTNGSAEWLANMEKLLYGDDHIQPNSVEASTGEPEAVHSSGLGIA